jgi:acylphosphatase
MPEARIHVVVRGIVQGVSFRYYTLRTANRLGLTGWVANRWDGHVETVAEGPHAALREFLAFLRHGSPSAVVERVDVRWETPVGEHRGFRVRHL